MHVIMVLNNHYINIMNNSTAQMQQCLLFERILQIKYLHTKDLRLHATFDYLEYIVLIVISNSICRLKIETETQGCTSNS